MMLRRVMKDSMPTMLAVMFYSLYGVMDGLFVGKATGDIGLAAVNIGWPLVALVMAVGVGVGTGGSVRISYYRGQGERKRAREVYGATVTLLILFGVVLMLLLGAFESILYVLGARGVVLEEAIRYIRILLSGSVVIVLGSGLLPVLRNIGMTIQALLCMVLGVVLNIGINYYLMMIVGIGVRGAAFGTILAQGIVVLVVFVLIYREKQFGIYLYLNRQCFKEILSAGITPFGIYIAPSITLIFTNWQCLRYGGDAVVASYAVISYIVFPVLSILGGVGDGTQPLISYYFGAGKQKDLREVKQIAHCGIVVLSVLITGAVWVLASPIAGWFGLSADASIYFVSGMRISAVAFMGQAFTKFHGVYLNATMRTGMAISLTYLESLVVSPVLLAIVPLFFGTVGIWLAPTITALVILGIYGIQNVVLYK